MKHLLNFIGSLLLFAVISMAISVLFGGACYLLYMFPSEEKPTWINFFGMAFIFWILMIINGIHTFVRFVIQSKKDTGKWIWQKK